MTLPNDHAGPIRTCVGCRAKRPQADLVRCVLDAAGIARVDRYGDGRGAWLCGLDCLDVAIRRRSIERAWRRRDRLPPAAFDSLAGELAAAVASPANEPEVPGTI
jgi:predicted RNA-binding protein YlxR (DUF448 family)